MTDAGRTEGGGLVASVRSALGVRGAGRRWEGSLGARLLAGCAFLMVLVAMVFGVTLVAIEDLSDSGREARHSQAVIEASDGIQTLVLDLETSVRG